MFRIIVNKVIQNYFLTGILFLVAKKFFPLEFSNKFLSDILDFLIWFSVGITFLIARFKELVNDKSNKTIQGIALITSILLVFGGLFFIVFFNLLGDNVYGRKYFESKEDKNIVIIGRHFDIGALADRDNKDKIVKLRPIGKYFNWVTKCDTLKIDKNQWNRIGT